MPCLYGVSEWDVETCRKSGLAALWGDFSLIRREKRGDFTPDSSGYGGYGGTWRHPENRDYLYGQVETKGIATIEADSGESISVGGVSVPS